MVSRKWSECHPCGSLLTMTVQWTQWSSHSASGVPPFGADANHCGERTLIARPAHSPQLALYPRACPIVTPAQAGAQGCPRRMLLDREGAACGGSARSGFTGAPGTGALKGYLGAAIGPRDAASESSRHPGSLREHSVSRKGRRGRGAEKGSRDRTRARGSAFRARPDRPWFPATPDVRRRVSWQAACRANGQCHRHPRRRAAPAGGCPGASWSRATAAGSSRLSP